MSGYPTACSGGSSADFIEIMVIIGKKKAEALDRLEQAKDPISQDRFKREAAVWDYQLKKVESELEQIV